MRQVGNGLNRSFENLIPYLVEKQGKDDGGGKTEEQVVKTNEKGVPQKAEEVGAFEKAEKVLKSHPFAVREAPGRGKLLKGNKGPVHGLVAEKGVKY
jgi:hypothetical protein